jgi:hypothetical protein
MKKTKQIKEDCCPKDVVTWSSLNEVAKGIAVLIFLGLTLCTIGAIIYYKGKDVGCNEQYDKVSKRVFHHNENSSNYHMSHSELLNINDCD